MGTTTKSISGLFANVCDRNGDRMVREQMLAGHGTRFVAAQGYLPLSPTLLSYSWLGEVRDQARWLLKRLGGHLTSALSNMAGMLPHTSGILSPAKCPARPRSQAVGRPRNGVQRFHG